MTNKTEQFSSSVTINILIVIDTDYIINNYPNPSQDPNNPTGIDHKSQFMICTDVRGTPSGQGTADLNFVAHPNDRVSFTGTSIYNNSDDAVIVYGIKHWSGDTVFNVHWDVDVVTLNRAVVPNTSSTSNNGLPPTQQPVNFISLQNTVARSGKESFYVYIAVYQLGDDGQTQQLYGYFYWDPSITVPA